MTNLRQFKITTLFPAIAVLAIASLALPRHAAAQVTWTGTSGGDWDTGANWSTGSKPTTTGTALFNTTLTSVANAVADQTVRSISFDTNAGTAGSGFTIGTAGGNTLTLGNGGTIQILSTLTGTGKAISVNAPLVLSPASASTAGSYTFANNNGTATNTLNFGGPISGGLTSGTVTLTLDGANTGTNTITGNISNGSAASLALTKTGAGTWVLSGSNTYTGNTTLANGNIRIAATSSLGVGGTISVTAGGGSIYGPSSQLIVEGVNDPLTGRNISMAAGSRVGINVVSAANTVNLSGTISGSGNIFKNGLGTLRLSGNNTGFSGPFTLGATYASNGTVEFTNANAFGTGTINGNAQGSVVMKNVSGGLLTLSNTFSSVNASGMFYFSGADTTLNGNQFGANAFYAATGMNLTLGGQINGRISLLASSGYQGTIYLNTAPGSTSYVDSLRFGSTAAPTIGIAADNAFGVTTGAQYTDAAISGLTLFASGADRSINSAMRWGGYNGVVNITGSNNLTFSANQNIAWFNTNGAQAFNVTAPMLTFSGIINETTANIWKNGSGVMVLSGSNTYTTQTRLSQGVIRATVGVGLPATSNLYFAGNGGVLETSGTFSRTLGTTAGQVQWAAPGWVSDLVVAGGTGGGAGGFAAFGGPLAVQLNGGTAAVTWNSGNFVQSGGALVLGSTTADNVVDFRNAIDLNGFTGTVRVNDNPNTTGDFARLSGVLSGAGSGLTKSGLGTLVLSNTDNSFTGKTTVQDGTLEIASIGNVSGGNSPLGAPTTAANGTIDLGSGTTAGTLRYTGSGHTSNRIINLAGTTGGGGIEANGSGALVLTAASTATGAGTKTFTLSGTSTADNSIGVIAGADVNVNKTASGLWRLTGASSYGGQLTVSNGTLIVAANVDQTGNSPFGSSTDSNKLPIIGSSAAGLSGTVALLVDGNWTIDRGMSIAALGGGSSQVAVLGVTGANTASFGGGNNITLGRGVTLQASSNGTVTFGNNWVNASGPVAFTIGSAGNDGVVVLESALPTSTGVSIVRGTARLQASTNDRINSATPVTIGSNLGAATLDINGQSQTLSNLSFAGNSGSITGGTLRLNPSQAVAVTGTGHTISSLVALDADASFTVNAASRLGISSAISGGFGLTKTGAGVLELSAANSYAGPTLVSAGSLLVNGSLASAVTVQSGGVLGGSGQLLGGLTVQAGGTFSPGNSPGLLTTSEVVLAGATLMEIDGLAPRGGIGGYDAVDVTGALTYGGSLVIDFGSSITSALADNTEFNLFDFGSYTGLFSSITTASDGSYYGGLTFTGTGNKWTAAQGSQTLEFTHSTGVLVIVPEPGAIALAGIGIAAAAYAYRRRR